MDRYAQQKFSDEMQQSQVFGPDILEIDDDLGTTHNSPESYFLDPCLLELELHDRFEYANSPSSGIRSDSLTEEIQTTEIEPPTATISKCKVTTITSGDRVYATIKR
jgi:hypothetical protein